MNDIYFTNVVDIGNLYMEHIFYEFENEPILFLCKDKMDNIYLCLCSDIRYGQKWVITKCTIDILKKAIEKDVDISSIFLHQKKAIIINMDLQGNENSFEIDTQNIDPLDLPKKGTYIKCNKAETRNYLTALENIFMCGNNCVYDTNKKIIYTEDIDTKYIELYGDAA